MKDLFSGELKLTVPYSGDMKILKHRDTPFNDVVVFFCGRTEMLKFHENGDIYVKGRLIENDKEVVDGLREFLKIHNDGGC